MSLKDLRDELKELRKTSGLKPISKMKKLDIALELERLRGKREETPPVASTRGEKPKKMESKIADVKVAKENGFPVAPAKIAEKKKAKGGAVASVAEPKLSKKDMLKKMLEDMSDSE